jgi:hypothetical protein
MMIDTYFTSLDELDHGELFFDKRKKKESELPMEESHFSWRMRRLKIGWTFSKRPDFPPRLFDVS